MGFSLDLASLSAHTRCAMSQIDDKYNSLGGPNSFLGAPMSPEVVCVNNAALRKRVYQYGSIYFFAQSTDGAHEVHGDIAQKFDSLGAEANILAYPVSDETLLFDGFGRMNFFAGGEIYWRSSTGPLEVHGAISGRYRTLGGPQGFLGYPLSNETVSSDNSGSFNQFDNGVIYWKGSTGAHEVHGAILAKWKSLGMQAGSLGYPLTNEMPVAS